MSNELTDFMNLNVNNIIFSETYNGKYTKFIPIGYSDSTGDDEQIHKLILNTPSNLYTNGIQPKYDNKTKTEIVGYNLFLNMWNKKKGPSPEELNFTNKINEILQYIREFLTSIKDELNIGQEMIDNIRILSSYGSDPEKTEKQQPKLFCKLMMNNKNKKILTQFIDEDTTETIDSQELIRKNGLVTGALKFENISITDRRITIEIRVIEMLFREIKPKTRRSLLLPNVDVGGRVGHHRQAKTIDEDGWQEKKGPSKDEQVSSEKPGKKVSDHERKNPYAALELGDDN